MTPDLEQKITRVLAADLVEAEKNSIMRDKDGIYSVFGKYQIVSTGGKATVWTPNRDPQNFSSLKSAMSWCIAEKYNQQLAAEIKKLDQEFGRLLQHDRAYMDIARGVLDPQRRVVIFTKSQEAHFRYQRTRAQLDDCISRAKYFQIRGFNNEIERTRQPSPHRTNRPGARKPNRSHD